MVQLPWAYPQHCNAFRALLTSGAPQEEQKKGLAKDNTFWGGTDVLAVFYDFVDFELRPTKRGPQEVYGFPL